jgi:hypothetical protein
MGNLCVTEKKIECVMTTKTPNPEKRGRGRPHLPDNERLIVRSIRLSPTQWAKIDANGMDWLRALIDRAKPPKNHE